MDNSYIKLYRMLIKKPIWLNSTPEHKSILITLLLLANHEPGEWEWMGEKFKVNPGQFVTSLESIRKKTGKGISIQSVRSCLKRLDKLDFATDKATKAGRLITIINWDSYQPKKNKATKIPTNDQQRTNKGPTPNKNDKNKENERKGQKDIPDSNESGSFYKTKSGKKLTGKRFDSFLLFWEAFNFKSGKASAADSWLKINPLTGAILKNIIDSAKKECQGRKSIIDSGGTPKWPQGWLSDRRWEDESYSDNETGVETDEEYAIRRGLV